MERDVPKIPYTKRAHTKSRQGCHQCRTRRVKCDENKPRCGTCTKRGEECIWRRPKSPQHGDIKAPRGTSQGMLNTPSNDSTTTEGSYFGITPPPSFNREICIARSDDRLAMMHHWCTRTCHSFTRIGSDLFRDHVGRKALDHDFLMDAVCATTLLHQASAQQEPTDMVSLANSALHYHHSAIIGLREALDTLSSDNCDAVFASSLLIMVCAIVSPLLSINNDITCPSMQVIVFTLVKMMHGVASVVDLTRPWLERGPFHQFFPIVEPKSLCPSSWPPAMELRALIESEMLGDMDGALTLLEAVAGLERVASRDICAVSWLTSIGIGLTEGLKESDPLAMMLFLHWATLLCTTDDMWWKQFVGRRLVQDLSCWFMNLDGQWSELAVRCRDQIDLL